MAYKLQISAPAKLMTIDEMSEITQYARKAGFATSCGHIGSSTTCCEAAFDKRTIHGIISVIYHNIIVNCKCSNNCTVEILWLSCKTTDSIGIENLNKTIEILEDVRSIYGKLVA